MQNRNAVLPLHLYFFIASWIFHVETNASNFLFMYSLLIFCFKTQVILATNVAESSVTVPDVKYGKLSKPCNSVYTVFVVFSILVLGLVSRIYHCSKHCCWSVEFFLSFTTEKSECMNK